MIELSTIIAGLAAYFAVRLVAGFIGFDAEGAGDRLRREVTI